MPTAKKIPAGIEQKLKQMNHSDLANTGFWVSQLFLVLATIVGVYLAAQAGLNQALRFDQISDWQNRYHLQRSLHHELEANVMELRRYATSDLGKQLSTQELQQRSPQIDQFIWETMRYSATTLETPTELLIAAKRFYRTTEDIVSKAEARTYGAQYAAEQLNKELEHMEQHVLPALQTHYQLIADDLAAVNVSVANRQEFNP